MASHTEKQAVDELSPKVLILTASIGGGHTAASNALAASFRSDGAQVIVTDLISSSSLAQLPRVYQTLTTGVLRPIWSTFFYLRKRSSMVRRINGRAVRRLLAQPSAQLKDIHYDHIILTHSMYCHIDDIIDPGLTKIIVYVTDLFGGAAEWFSNKDRRFVVASKQIRDAGLGAGVPSVNMLLRRLSTDVMLPTGRHRRSERTHVQPNILLLGGSEGAGDLLKVVKALLAVAPLSRITLVCGHNLRLHARAGRIANSKLTVEGYIKNLPQYIERYSLVVTKPGSLSLMEIFDLKVPFYVLKGIPGIEAENWALLRKTQGFSRFTRRRLKRLITPDGRLTAEGLASVQRIQDLGDEIPPQRFKVSEARVTAEWGWQG